MTERCADCGSPDHAAAQHGEYRGFRITELWAYTNVGPDDEEGVCAFLNGDVWIPMIAADRRRLDQLRPQAETVVRATGRAVTLRRFSAVDSDVEEVIVP